MQRIAKCVRFVDFGMTQRIEQSSQLIQELVAGNMMKKPAAIVINELLNRHVKVIILVAIGSVRYENIDGGVMKWMG